MAMQHATRLLKTSIIYGNSDLVHICKTRQFTICWQPRFMSPTEKKVATYIQRTNTAIAPLVCDVISSEGLDSLMGHLQTLIRNFALLMSGFHDTLGKPLEKSVMAPIIQKPATDANPNALRSVKEVSLNSFPCTGDSWKHAYQWSQNLWPN